MKIPEWKTILRNHPPACENEQSIPHAFQEQEIIHVRRISFASLETIFQTAPPTKHPKDTKMMISFVYGAPPTSAIEYDIGVSC